MTADLTAEQAARLAEFEAAEPAPESIRERVAVAIAQTGYETIIDEDAWQYIFREDEREDFRTYADAALDVLRGPATEADKAIERVLALADRHEDCCGTVNVASLREAIEQP